jgi:MYXO-CTERM domain-containing protein
LLLALAVVLPLVPSRAHAYSTRVHIMIANRIREALIEAGDGTIPLRMSDHAVVLATEDFEALRDFPLEFRAGAVGPDNMVFPGMTDPSHALGQRPYEQCELLYQAALTGGERAYALGCFLHGATDAVAHHYVNYMSGETFTLNPLSSSRETGLENVVRHILAESAIQDAAYTGDPEGFGTGDLLHLIPADFVLRTYLDQDSALWQLVAAHALEEYEAARAAMPGASLPTVVASMDVAPADHLVLSPVYLGEVEQVIDDQRVVVQQAIVDMQDPGSPDGSQLLVTEGPDGVLGTKDDETDCAFTCPTLYATYFTYVGLLAPRFSAGGQELPPAFDEIAGELRAELQGFHPAYLATVANISAKLNEPLTATDSGLGFTRAEVEGLFTPMVEWSDAVATIDYDTLVYAIIPDWIIELDTAMQAVGVDVNLAGIIEAVFQPFIAPIREAIQEAFIAQAEVFLGDLADEYIAAKEAVEAEYEGRLQAEAPAGLDGTMLDHFYDSGLFAHSFNIAAATMASHAAVLPVGDAAVGPASFDASYTPAWMQAGACAHLSEVIFPLGIDVRGSMSVRMDGTDYVAQPAEDSPVECHDGALDAFADAPSMVTCMLTDLEALLADPVGSLSRAYPPSLSAMPAQCEGLVIPGLPAPPEGEDESGGSGDGTGDGTAGTGGGTALDGTGAGADGEGGGGGCGCREGAPSSGGALGLLGVLGLLGLRRRRTVVAVVVLATTSIACGDDDGGITQPTGDATTTSGPGDTTMGTNTPEDTTNTPETATGSGSSDSADATSDPPDDPLLDALDGTVWSGEQTRDGLTRGYELAFDTGGLLWSEIRNPYGPARLREMRVMIPGAPGAVSTTVISPQGWPIHPENGRTDEWTLELVEGAPRVLRITRDGVTEEFTEGPFPVPQDGLTAVVRVFEVGGVVDQAFCDSGSNGFDYPALFAFANGNSTEIVATDVVAGAHLQTWSDPGGGNSFSVVDVEGFDRLGGTELSDSYNFFVTYVGTVDHPGGSLVMREADDSVEDAVWAFLGDAVGSDNVGDIFLEVQGFIWPDATADEPSTDLAAGDVPIQAIVVRCTEQITDVDVEISLGGAGFELLGNVGSTPLVDDELFPPAL